MGLDLNDGGGSFSGAPLGGSMLDAGGAIGAGVSGVGAIAGAIGDYYSNKETNATNVQLSEKSMAFNAEQAHQQMMFQERMANTAYQRQMDDLRKAGLNPMLAMKGSGASSGSGAAASSTPARVEAWKPSESLNRMASTASSIIDTLQSFEAKKADIEATRAAAAASHAQAQNSMASAQATIHELPTIKAKAKAAGVEAEQRAQQAAIDKDYAKYDAVVRRVLEGLGGATDAVNIRRLIQGTKSGAQRDHEFLEKRGASGVRVR